MKRRADEDNGEDEEQHRPGDTSAGTQECHRPRTEHPDVGGGDVSATLNDVSIANPLCFTRFEFADAFQVSVRTVDRMIAAGEIRVRRIRGKAVRIPRSEFERYLGKAEGGKKKLKVEG